MRNFNTNTTDKDEWLTPPYILDALGPFDLDPCAPINPPWPMAKHHYTIMDRGLLQPWKGRVWLNPHYGKETFKWVGRLADHGSGIAMIFARTETKGFHQEVWAKATGVFFFEGRINFYTVKGRRKDHGNAPSCLVVYSEEDFQIVQRSKLLGILIRIKN